MIWFVRLPCEAGLGVCTAAARRARSKEFLINKYSELCELCVSVVNTPSRWKLRCWKAKAFEEKKKKFGNIFLK